MNRYFHLPLTTLLLVLAGCTPHPATGTWTADTAESGFSRLEITYEGRANLFEAGEKEAGRHCFWGGTSAQTIAMTCKPASNKDIEEQYQLNVGQDGTATLMQGDNKLVSFSRLVR